jgi:hypothetical protein
MKTVTFPERNLEGVTNGTKPNRDKQYIYKHLTFRTCLLQFKFKVKGDFPLIDLP